MLNNFRLFLMLFQSPKKVYTVGAAPWDHSYCFHLVYVIKLAKSQ